MRSPRRAPTVCGRMISGSVSLPWKGFFSPFPHGTCSLSVDGRYSALEGGPPGFGRSFTCSALLRMPAGCAWGFRRWGCHPLRPDFPDGPAIRRATMARSYNPAGHVPRFGLLRVRSPLLAESRLISSPQGTEMFHFPWCRPCHLWIEWQVVPGGTGLLHSETHGSEATCAYPWTIAACRVLHRSPSPRHPSCAQTACRPEVSQPHDVRRSPRWTGTLSGHLAARQPVSVPAGLCVSVRCRGPALSRGPAISASQWFYFNVAWPVKELPEVSPGGKQRNMRRVGLACAPGGAGLIP